jgi:hypothetical protein
MKTKITDQRWRGDFKPDNVKESLEWQIGMPLEVFLQLLGQGYTRLDDMRAAWRIEFEKN